MPTTCPFCSPYIDNSVFAQSTNFKAVYNIAPILPGHTLIISNNHISRFLEIEDSLMEEMIVFSRKVMKTLSKAFKTESFDWTLQEGVEAGQTVDHMHIHIIPRHEKDLASPGDWYPRLKSNESNIIDSLTRPKLTGSELLSIVKYLKEIYTNATS